MMFLGPINGSLTSTSAHFWAQHAHKTTRIFPQTVACQHGVLAVNLSIRLWSPRFGKNRPPHFFHTSLLILTISNHRFQNVAVVPVRIKTSLYIIICQ